MPKWLMFSLAAMVDLVFAVIAYRSGRVMIPVLLSVAFVCFVIAAVGSVKGTKGGAG